MPYHSACNKNNTMGGTCGAEISYHSTAPIPPRLFLHVLVWFVLFIFSSRSWFHIMVYTTISVFILIYVYWCPTRFRCRWFSYRLRLTQFILCFSEVRVAWSIVLCVVFCRLLFVVLSFISFEDCIICPSSIYHIWLTFWSLQTFFYKK